MVRIASRTIYSGALRGSNLVGMAMAWVIRSGRYGERDSWALKHGCSGGGWAEVPDLTNVTTREQIAQVVIDTYPGSDALIASYFDLKNSGDG